MALMRWDPVADIDRMLDLVAASARGGNGGSQAATRSMPMDVYRQGDEYIVEMDLPGVDPSSIDISVERNMITVEAEAESTHEQADEQILCERRHVRYRRQLYLGDDVDTENIQASYDNGVLRLTVPIAQEQRSRKVQVAAGDNRTNQISAQNQSGQQGQSSGGDASSSAKREPATTGAQAGS
ncbi:MAG: 18 kDa antigen 2 [Actinomycetia bacterium]|jgi:HSP20 family protein|nr:18 kDa antigen 2 [Actinomycetes bacterium]